MANQNVVQQVLQELADVEGLLKDNLISIEAYIGGCSSVLSQLVSSNKLTFAEKREALKAAKQQHQISQRVLQEAGKQLLDTKLQQLSFAAAAAADTPAGGWLCETPGGGWRSHLRQLCSNRHTCLRSLLAVLVSRTPHMQET